MAAFPERRVLYYTKEELKNRGIELSSVGLTPEKPSCYVKRCNLPFKEGNGKNNIKALALMAIYEPKRISPAALR